jgi:predicted ATPase
MRILSVRQLTQRLNDVFGVLTGGARSAPARHQALRATLDWSHDLLAAAEQVVFRRLAVFSGGFPLAAAERVAAFGDIDAGQVLDLLTHLADKSLLRVERERYHLLATIREYATDKLAASGELDEVRRAHLAYYTGFAEQAGSRADRADAEGLEAELDRLDLERANLRVASDYARQSGDAVAALRRRVSRPLRLPARPLPRDQAVDGPGGDRGADRAAAAARQGAVRQRASRAPAVRL